jgi:guanylate kinase
MQREPQLEFSISFTTRTRRPTERAGVDYHFVAPAEFERMVAHGELLEHAKVFDNYYGTGRATVENALAAGRRLLLEIDWQGAAQVRARLPEARGIFILPPSRESLEQRLRQRSTDSDAVILRRLQDSVQDLAHWVEFDYVVVNDRFDDAVGELQRIVANQGDDLRGSRPAVAALAGRLLA